MACCELRDLGARHGLFVKRRRLAKHLCWNRWRRSSDGRLGWGGFHRRIGRTRKIRRYHGEQRRLERWRLARRRLERRRFERGRVHFRNGRRHGERRRLGFGRRDVHF